MKLFTMSSCMVSSVC